MESYKASYVWTKDELRKATLSHSRMQLRPSLLLVTKIFAFLLGALVIFLQIVRGLFEPFAWGLALFCAYWIVFGGRGTTWLLLYGFAKSPYADKTIEIEISPEQVSQHCEDLLVAQFSWKVFGKVVAVREGLLLYTYSKNTFFWLPYNGFETPECIEKVKQFARSHDIKIVEEKR